MICLPGQSFNTSATSCKLVCPILVLRAGLDTIDLALFRPSFMCFYLVSLKTMVLGALRANIIWKLLRNDSGVILELLKIYPEHDSNVKVRIWIIDHNINSQIKKPLTKQTTSNLNI